MFTVRSWSLQLTNDLREMNFQTVYGLYARLHRKLQDFFLPEILSSSQKLRWFSLSWLLMKNVAIKECINIIEYAPLLATCVAGCQNLFRNNSISRLPKRSCSAILGEEE
jgi:hypothetical protein